MKCGCGGWETVCPDGRVRSFPGHNRGDVASESAWFTKHRDCKWEKGDPKAWREPPCPQGKHTTRRVRS